MHAFVVGRGRDADLQLDDESVSRRHAKLAVMSDGLPAIEDLGSQNGTFINGKAIVGSARLQVGDRITLGSCDLEVLATYAPNPLGYERATEPLARERVSREPPSTDLLGALSKREREIFVLLAEGIAQREIAKAFGVSTKTIETHRTRIGQKLQIKTRADLVRIALASGVLRPDSEA
jgi:DNA-binding CsgD family transcriptional regulator